MLSRLRLSDVRRMAGLGTFRRGEAAYEQGLVGHVVRRGSSLHAEVLAGHLSPFRVEVRESKSDLVTHCTCASEADETCEHIVAALLWWLEEGRAPRPVRAAVDLEDVTGALRRKTKDELVDLLVELGLRDDGIMNRFELAAARVARKSVDATRYLRMIRNALSRKFVDYYHTGDFLRNLDLLREDLDRLREAGQSEVAHRVTAHFLEKALDRYREVEDTDLRFADVLQRIIDSYGASLAASGLDSEAAAAEVFALIDAADTGFLEPLVRATTQALGTAGLQSLEAVGRSRLDAAQAGASPFRGTVSRRKLRQLLKSIARARGDETKYLALLREGLEGSSDYLLAAERLLALGRVAEASQLASEGLTASPRRDPRLLHILAALAERGGDVPAAADHALAAFEESPTHEALHRVTALAVRAGKWPELRSRVLARLRRQSGSPLLIELLLEEGKLDEMVKGARKGWFGEPVLEKVAHRIEAAHPDAAASLYEELVRRFSERRGEGDRQAVSALKALADLRRRAGQERKLNAFLRGLSRAHGKRRDFLRRMEAAAGA